MHPSDIFKTDAYQRLSASEKYRIDCLPSKERLEALNNLDRYSQDNQRFTGYKEADIGVAFSKLPTSEQERITALPPVARLSVLRSLVKN